MLGSEKMEKSKKKGSIRGRVKKRISKIQYQKAIKNESYYANLSALFLCVSIALGLGGVVAGSVLTVVYQPILNETLSIVFILISVFLFVVSIIGYGYTHKLYKEIQKQNLKNMIKSSSEVNNREIYVLGTLVMLIVEVTAIYFANSTLSNQYQKYVDSKEEIKSQIADQVDGKVEATYNDDYSKLSVIFNKDYANGSATINLTDKNRAMMCDESEIVYMANLNQYNADSMTDEFIDYAATILNIYQDGYSTDTLMNELSGNVRVAVNGLLENVDNTNFQYERDFNLSKGKVHRNLSVTRSNQYVTITLTYTCR